MSLGYAEKLSYREDLGGQLGAREHFETGSELKKKIDLLASLVKQARRIVVFTGAGISTSCGIPDFRGPRGIWTYQRAGKPLPEMKTSFVAAKPSYTHQALVALLTCGKLSYLVSQNVDGLHLRSGIPRDKMAELHGNCFAERCETCSYEYIRDFEIETVGFRYTRRRCVQPGCGGQLKDHILDWEDELPEEELRAAERHAGEADLAICLGTSLQITPACNLPLYTVKAGGKLVIINLQKTPKDKKAALVIHARCDDVMRPLMTALNLSVPPYRRTDTIAICMHQHLTRVKQRATPSAGQASRRGATERATQVLCGSAVRVGSEMEVPCSGSRACGAEPAAPAVQANTTDTCAATGQLDPEPGTTPTPAQGGEPYHAHKSGSPGRAKNSCQGDLSPGAPGSSESGAVEDFAWNGPPLSSQHRAGSYPFTLTVQNQYGSKWPVPLLQHVEFKFQDPQLAGATRSSPPFKVTRTVKAPGEYPVVVTLQLSEHADEGRREIRIPYVIRIRPEGAKLCEAGGGQGQGGKLHPGDGAPARASTLRSETAATAGAEAGLRHHQHVQYASYTSQEVQYEGDDTGNGVQVPGEPVGAAAGLAAQPEEGQLVLGGSSEESGQQGRGKRLRRTK